MNVFVHEFMQGLRLAAMHNYVKKNEYIEVQSLLMAGVDPNGKSKDDQTALMKAASMIDTNFDGLRRRIEMFDLLIEAGADIHSCDANGLTVLHHAALGGSVEIVQRLVDKGAVVDMKNSEGDTPLMIAAKHSHRDIVELLMNSGTDIHCINVDGSTALHCASRVGSVEIVQRLVDKGAVVDMKNSEGNTPLMIAAKHSHRDIVELLMNSGTDVHCINANGSTALHHASRRGSIEIVQNLLSKGVAVNLKNSLGETPFMAAVKYSHRENTCMGIVELLMNSGSDINSCDNNGNTALHYASVDGSVDIAQYLVSKRALLNSKNSAGLTPLMIAVKHSYPGRNDLSCALTTAKFKVADYLLKVGADCNCVSYLGASSFNILLYGYSRCPRRERVELIKLCIEKGAIVKSNDYKILLEDPVTKTVILQDVKLCSQAFINKFNNLDLPLLYKGLGSGQRLPPIEQLKIGNESRMSLKVEQAVTREIQSNGFCNLIEMVPNVLSILCVKSLIKKSRLALKRGTCQSNENSPKRLCLNNDISYEEPLFPLFLYEEPLFPLFF